MGAIGANTASTPSKWATERRLPTGSSYCNSSTSSSDKEYVDPDAVHTKVATFKNPEGPDYDRWVPDLHKETWSVTHKWADMILFGCFDTHLNVKTQSDKKGKAVGGQTRMLMTERSPRGTPATGTDCLRRLSWATAPRKRGKRSQPPCRQRGRRRVEPCTKRRYFAKITSQALTRNKKGNPEVQLTVLPLGQYDMDGNYEPRSFQWERTVFLSLTDKTIGTAHEPGWVLETLRFLGFKGDSFSKLDPAVEGSHSFVDKEVDVLCKTTKWDRKTIEKWSFLRAGGKRTEAKPVAAKEVRALEPVGQVLKATAKAAPPTAKPKAERQPGEDDGLDPQEDPNDIPF